jgi:hypothetical protein
MILVPRQLLRAGMTGNVPYYGGRLTPAQAYAASHPSGPPRETAPQASSTQSEDSGRASKRATVGQSQSDPLSALRHLRETGVITSAEFDELHARVAR